MFRYFICQAIMSLHNGRLLRQDWLPSPGSGSTLQVTCLWLCSQNHSTQMVENKRPSWPTTFQLLFQPSPQPSWVCLLPPFLSTPTMIMHLCPPGLTKDHTQNTQMLVQYGKAEKRAI